MTTWISTPGSNVDVLIPAALPITPSDVNVTLLSATTVVAGTPVVAELSVVQVHPLGYSDRVEGVQFVVNATGDAWVNATVAELGNGLYRITTTTPLAGTYHVAVYLVSPTSGAHVPVGAASFVINATTPPSVCSNRGSVLGVPHACSCVTGGSYGALACVETCAPGAGFSCCGCTCSSDYAGPSCGATCPMAGGAQCNGRGVCDAATATCRCGAGFFGAACELACPGSLASACSGHGVCDGGTGTCQCSHGWWGEDCSHECPGGGATPCGGHGTCNGTSGECACDLHHYGAACESYCHAEVTCNGGGRCSDAGACVCGPAHGGTNCDVGLCGEANACSGHGYCGDAGCSCVAGFYGPVCADSCPGWDGSVSCSGHGGCGPLAPDTCCSDGHCMCESGYWDKECSSECSSSSGSGGAGGGAGSGGSGGSGSVLDCSSGACQVTGTRRVATQRVRIHTLVVVTDPSSAADAAALAVVRRTLRSVHSPWTEVALSAGASLQLRAAPAAGGGGLYHAIVMTSFPTAAIRSLATAALTAVETYEKDFHVRRVFLLSSPADAGVGTVPAAAMPPTAADVGVRLDASVATHPHTAAASSVATAAFPDGVVVPLTTGTSAYVYAPPPAATRGGPGGRGTFLVAATAFSNSLCTTTQALLRLVDTSASASASALASGSSSVGVDVPNAAAAVALYQPSGEQHLHVFLPQDPDSLVSALAAGVWLEWVTRGVYVGVPWGTRLAFVGAGFCAGSSNADEWAPVPASHVTSNVAAVGQQATLLPSGSVLSLELSLDGADQAALRADMGAALEADVTWSDWDAVGAMPAPCTVHSFLTATACSVSTARTSCNALDAPVHTAADFTNTTIDGAFAVLSRQPGAFVFHPSALVVDNALGTSLFSRWMISVLARVRTYVRGELDTLSISLLHDLQAQQAQRDAGGACAGATAYEVLDQAGNMLAVEVETGQAGCVVSVAGLTPAASSTAAVATLPTWYAATFGAGGVASSAAAQDAGLKPAAVAAGSAQGYTHTTGQHVTWVGASGVAGGAAVQVAASVTVSPFDVTTNLGQESLYVGIDSVLRVAVLHPVGLVPWDRPSLVLHARVAAGNSSAVLENVASLSALPRNVKEDFEACVSCGGVWWRVVAAVCAVWVAIAVLAVCDHVSLVVAVSVAAMPCYRAGRVLDACCVLASPLCPQLRRHATEVPGQRDL